MSHPLIHPSIHPTQRSPSRRPRRAFTLIELVLALCITVILFGAIGSAMLLCARAVPLPTDAQSSSLAAAQAADRIAGELETALLVLEQTSTAIAFTVPPRNGDAYPAKIRYSWAGSSGSPLLRQYNGGTAAAVIDKVDQFSLTPALTTSAETYPGLGVEDSSDSLLFDYSNVLSLTSANVSSTVTLGQYFASASWPAGVVGWRPTRVLISSKKSGSPATTYVQMSLPDANLLPTSTVLEQGSFNESGLLGLTYAWQQVSFSRLPRLAPSGGICMMLAWGAGSPYSAVIQTSSNAGMLSKSGSGSWGYVSSKAVQAQLYGKLTRSTTTQSCVSTYMTALTISLRGGSSNNPTVQTTARLLNHPELLASFWELKFDKSPTAVDVNGDRLADWAVHGGGTFNTATLVNNTWQTGGLTLDSVAGSTFANRTVVDLRVKANTSGSWAGIALNAARSGSTCAPVYATLTRQADGTQTLAVQRKLDDFTLDTMLSVTSLPSTAVDLHFIIDPAYGSVGVSVNGTPYGSFAYNRYTAAELSQLIALTSGGNSQFEYVRVREMQPGL
ncbi:MAG: hypothetical protein NTW19_20260 [Planctomycetota bacterium]|nr:hypothetical protein [Planctomycetota bacterium]